MDKENLLAKARIAFLVANAGVEQVELTAPWQRVLDAAGEPVLVAPERGTVQAMNHDLDQGDTFDVDVCVADADVSSFAALVLPGGVANPDRLRTDSAAMTFVRAFAAVGKPIAAICHGPWSLVETGLVEGKSLTSWPSLQTDIRNAGGDWVDEPVVVCPKQDFELVTSRNPGDLDVFSAQLVKTFSKHADGAVGGE